MVTSTHEPRPIPAGRELHELSIGEFRQRLEQMESFLGSVETDQEREAVLLLAGRHPVWQVRRMALDFAQKWYPLQAAEQTILQGAHDSVDTVAFRAIELCGKLRLKSAVTHLVRISGWPSHFCQSGYLRKPVGVGASLTKRALTDILGSRDAEMLRRIEDEVLSPMHAMVNAFTPEPSTEGMIPIPGGPCIVGMKRRDDVDFMLAHHDYVTEKPQVVDVPTFWIDEKPVTNAQYRAFVRSVESNGHNTCHPDEPPHKDHWPSHLMDPRFMQPDHPVVGVDWYDAWAYAAWCGKKLPSELQWEKAARGPDGREYPWGDQWRPELAIHAEVVFGSKISTLDSWEDVLRNVSDDFPAKTVWEVGRHPGGASPYGVLDMAGHVWEWTRTNFLSRRDMDPFFKGRHVLDFTNRVEAFPVIRGGCWSSIPEMLRASYRGKDLLTDRHFEIGFRCVVELDERMNPVGA